jgi:hypothetical protein
MFSSRSVTERDRAERLRRNVIASRIAGDRMMVAFERLRTLALREKFNPDQPRVPQAIPTAANGPEEAANPRERLTCPPPMLSQA